jgi:hypothetical protein
MTCDDRPQRRERRGQRRGEELKDPLGLGDPMKPMRTQVACIELG